MDNLKEISLKAKHVISILEFVEYYSLVFIITSSVGFFFSLLFVALRSKNIINSTT